MDIKEIEAYVTSLYLAKDLADASKEYVLSWVQCQLLLHIYRKLESIDESLKALSTSALGK